MNPDLLLAHYHEIGLKGRNRPRFERALRDNLKRALGDSAARVRLVSGRVEITDPKPDALEKAARVFGVANVAPVLVAPADLDAIVATAVDVARDADLLTPFDTFEVRARRARTGFATTSQVVNETVGDAVRLGLGKRVNLSRPDVSVRIEIVHDKAYISAAKIPGP
ncbi:MAG TPA: THUMP domain-containing protein, partial [Acidimicrobiia bacterium]|nr:THUMP domain-containing protein [Acidimicrobiia bacterium]